MIEWLCIRLLGVVQGVITGIRGLCNGLGPAFYGFIFYLFHVELTDLDAVDSPGKEPKPNMANPADEVRLWRIVDTHTRPTPLTR